MGVFVLDALTVKVTPIESCISVVIVQALSLPREIGLFQFHLDKS